ncbi:hypothetical protein [Bosea sp. FBZP-16]|uniref:hypothetical protein n=1 Tax=Bosea sp. FBZP-16 TaxID=2065382 RepID=UPI000C301263|nr:hypothetical protein [Bosea sp. FBZP-16]
MQETAGLARLFLRLWRQAGPVLLLLATLGSIANELLLPLAVRLGYLNSLAGFAMLALLVLAKLVVTVLMFIALRPYLPAVSALQIAGASQQPDTPQPAGARAVIGLVALALVPFFAYYAAWGFLGDTVRDYSVRALSEAGFGEKVDVLAVPLSLWLALAIGLAWLVRKLAKAAQSCRPSPFWQFLVIACDANWIFVGLYALSRWKDTAWTWLKTVALPYLRLIQDWTLSLIGKAQAATPEAIDLAAPPFSTSLQSLFLYALLPLVWLLMAATIYGYDAKDPSALARDRRAAAALARWQSAPKAIRDFAEHFIGGYRSRYLPVVNSVRLAFGASLSVLIALVVGYRFIGFAAAWLWIGLTRLIGPLDLDSWQVIANAIAFLLGGPSEIRGGILVESLRICLLAAVMETAVAAQSRSGASPESRSADSAAARPAG